MSTIGLPLNAGSLPYTCYPATPQQFYADMFSRGSALFPSIKGVVVSDTVPAAGDQDKLWIKTSNGAPIGQFIFFNAHWVWPHLSTAGGSERRMWVGLEADLVNYDGGDANPAGPSSGAMWAVDHDFDGRSPMGPGAIPDTVDNLGVNGNYGHGTHAQTIAEMPTHTHPITAFGTNTPSNGNGIIGGSNGTTGPFTYSDSTTPMSIANTGGGAAMSLVHPVRGIFLIKRTSRIYYLGA